MLLLLRRSRRGILLHEVDDGGEVGRGLEVDDLVAAVGAREGPDVRWIWDDTRAWYPELLRAGVRVARCADLRLRHRILRRAPAVRATPFATAVDGPWDEDEAEALTAPDTSSAGPALFDLLDGGTTTPAGDRRDPVAEYREQESALASADDAGRLRLLLAAESAGALVAEELRHAGLPWRTDVHDRLLVSELGTRPPPGERPARLAALARTVRDLLDAQDLNPDSPPDVLRALRRAGLVVDSTRAWELREVDHPVIPPLLEYKKLARLLAANGWAWAEAWVRDGRFRADFIPGGVVTGRWATRGGGALQLPRQVRGAVVADPGWRLVVADAAQLEPRVLSGMARDTAMATAGRGRDLYQGVVDSGAVDTRQHAKIAMLGALYGATSGEAGRLAPRLHRAFPRAVDYVERAARTGESGGVVESWLGRGSPAPGESWREVQGAASGPDASAADERRARSRARDQGRFTRNFVVQASAAEWALAWMADLRGRLAALRGAVPGLAPAPFDRSPHLVFFLHDEVIVHTPADLVDEVAGAVRESARSAGRLLFGDAPVEFPLTVAAVDDYGQAKG